MKKVLMVTPAFPPIGGSHMQRMINFANSIAEMGIELHVIACEPSLGHPCIDYKSKSLINENIKVYYAPEGFLHRRAHSYAKKIDKRNIKKKKSIISMLLGWGNKFKKKLLIPDTMIDWYFSTMKYIKDNNLIERINPDAIISCSMPNTVHLIGYKLAKKYNIKLIMDYGDPWVYETSIKRGKFRFMIERYIESKILKKASHVCFATKTTRDLYINKYNIKPEKTTVAMMGFYEKDIINNSINDGKKCKRKCLSMTYGGALNPAHRNPIPLFEAVKHLLDLNHKIEIQLRVDEITRISQQVKFYGLEKNILVKGYIPFDEYLQEAKYYDVLILFGNSSPLQIPGKLFNYIGTGMRILYIKNMDKEQYDPTEEILNKYGNAICVENNPYKIANAILSLQMEKLNGGIRRTTIDHILEYSWKNQGNIFAKAVFNCVNKNNNY